LSVENGGRVNPFRARSGQRLGRTTVAKVERVAQQVRGDALNGLSGDELATASHVLEHVCRMLAPLADEPGP
jgi:hypothetical protein